MLNVLHVSTFFTEHGGVEKSVSDLSHALAGRHSVRVLCTTRGRTVKRVSGGVDVTAAGGWITLSGRPLSLSFVKELSAHQVDVVHYHLPCPMAVISHPVAAPAATIKVATWHHDLVRHKFFNALSGPLTQRFLESMDAIIVTAPALLEGTPILRRFRNKCRVIPLGVDDQRFSIIDHNAVLDARARYGSPLLLYVGRLVYYKGCDVLIKAMSLVEGANLVMAGTGPLREDLRELIRRQRLDERVHLIGWQPEVTLRSLFQACDLFVLPSTLPTECFGLVQVEAMLCGKPVINTSLPTGVPWVSLNAETGLTVPPANHVELAHSINDLLADHELRHMLGANARRRAEEMFTLQKQVSLTVELYEQLLSKASRAQTALAGKVQ